LSFDVVRASKFLSLILRHEPARAGLVLDEQGWVEVDALLAGCNQAGRSLTREQLDRIVAENDKRRFSFSEDGCRIRANQGHSVEIDLALSPQRPPDVLYHGTATRFLASIRATGLKPGSRQHVHLTHLHETAIKVGQRHGKPVVLIIRAAALAESGQEFFCSDNGVWLTAPIAVEFIEFPM
jgi:putative RNA 2'-phosphotransferase